MQLDMLAAANVASNHKPQAEMPGGHRALLTTFHTREQPLCLKREADEEVS